MVYISIKFDNNRNYICNCFFIENKGILLIPIVIQFSTGTGSSIENSDKILSKSNNL